MNKLDASRISKELIRIETKHPDGTTVDGIVLAHSRAIVIMREMTAFEPDGTIIIPKKWIKKVRNGKREKCASEIIKSSNTLPASVDSLEVSEWRTLQDVIASLKKRDVWPAVEILSSGCAPLYVGPITEVSKSWFKVRCYDACGKWEKVYEIEYQEIFRIETESKYVKRFNAFMRREKPGNMRPG